MLLSTAIATVYMVLGVSAVIAHRDKKRRLRDDIAWANATVAWLRDMRR